ncbi:MAG: caspase family protein [Elusimicrobia bacterium]|nr:caspase family protein [Elusimicrobiota bacterium]
MNARFHLFAALAFTLAAAPAAAQEAFDAGAALRGAKDAAGAAPAVGPAVAAGQSSPKGKASVTYGVILNGDTERRHQLNATMLKEHMIRYYGADAKNITILSTDQGLAPTRQNLVKTAADLKQKAGPDDRVIVYTTGHGFLAQDKKGTVYTLAALPNDDAVTDVAMAGAFLDNKAGSYVYLGDQCYSGGFAKKFTANAAKSVIAISSTDDQNSTVCGFFIIPFVEASKDLKNDTDKDGRVSEREAYAAAKGVSETEHDKHGFPKGASNALYLTSGAAAKGRGAGK